MKKYVKDLTYDELKELIRNNDDIADRASERAESDVRFWAEEYLDGHPRSLDYSLFSWNGGDYIEFDEIGHNEIAWLRKQNNTYGLFDEATMQKVDRIEEVIKLMDEAYYDDDDAKYAEYESEYDDLKSEIEDACYEAIAGDINHIWDIDIRADIVSSYFDEFFEDGDWVDTDIWEIHNIDDEDDEENEDLDYDLDEQLELPID